MDEIKDIKAKDISDTERLGGLYNYVLQKTEKLTAALYLVTDFLSDGEPLKVKLRLKSLDLLTDANVPKKDNGGVAGWENFLLGVNEVVSLLKIGCVMGNVSRMNFEILSDEYQSMLKIIENQIAGRSLRDYLYVQAIRPASIGEVAIPSAKFVDPNVQSKNVPIKNKFSGESVTLSNIGQKDNRKDTANDLYGLNSKDNKKSIRKEQIATWLKDKSWTSIAEIASAVPDCGLKTIQRELLDMVSQGILKKQGERRWSRYMLNS